MPKINCSNLIFICRRYTGAGLKYLGIAGLLLCTLSLSQPVQASGLIGDEAQIIQLTNQIRVIRGIPALTHNGALDESAQNKADDMASKGYFSHEDQDGNRMSYWMGLAGYDYLRAGENLAKGFSSPEAVIQAWLNSPTHYANMVNANYIEIGIGVANGVLNGRPTTFVVQHFGQPMPQLNIIPTLIATPVLGDTAVAFEQSVPLPPSTGGIAYDSDLIVYERVSDSAVINTAPKGLLFVAYEGIENTTITLAQIWDGWQNSFPEVPYANDLPRTSYQLIQVFIVMGWFAGAAWLVYRLGSRILARLKHKPAFVIKSPPK